MSSAVEFLQERCTNKSHYESLLQTAEACSGCSTTTTGWLEVSQKRFYCRTCGLTYEKEGRGMCAACARRCHSGHDVYVRVPPIATCICDCPLFLPPNGSGCLSRKPQFSNDKDQRPWLHAMLSTDKLLQRLRADWDALENDKWQAVELATAILDLDTQQLASVLHVYKEELDSFVAYHHPQHHPTVYIDVYAIRAASQLFNDHLVITQSARVEENGTRWLVVAPVDAAWSASHDNDSERVIYDCASQHEATLLSALNFVGPDKLNIDVATYLAQAQTIGPAQEYVRKVHALCDAVVQLASLKILPKGSTGTQPPRHVALSIISRLLLSHGSWLKRRRAACARCGAPGPAITCTLCNLAFYCSTDCQDKAMADGVPPSSFVHKAECAAFQALQALR